MKVKFALASYCAIMLAACGPALAVEATVVLDTNLFERPRIGANEIAGLPVGTAVDLQRCEQMAWCLIDASGRKGWVPMVALAFEGIPITASTAIFEGDSSDGAPGTPKLVGGLKDLLGGQNSGPKLSVVGPSVTIARPIAIKPKQEPASDKAALKP